MASTSIVAAEMPEDVLMLILSLLPVKTLLRFKLVSNYWYSIIENPSFISLHHNRVGKSKDFLVATGQTLTDGQLDDDAVFSMHMVPNQTSPIEHLDLSLAGLHDNNVKGVIFLGCHNGVMCLANDVTSSIVIFNPAMRQSRVLPQPLYESKHRSFLGFTFDPKANDYKVIRFCSIWEFLPFVSFYEDLPDRHHKDAYLKYDDYCGDQKVQIYDLSTDSWRETDAVVPKDFPDGHEPHCCISLDGSFYWFGLDFFGTRVCIISAFHTFEERFERIPLPDSICFPFWKTQLCVLHDSLALVRSMYCSPQKDTSIDIWIMNDDGVDEGWTKRYSVGPLSGEHIMSGFLPTVELLLNCNCREMVSYNLSTHEIKEYNNQFCNRLELWSVDVQVFQYAESLISVKRRVD